MTEISREDIERTKETARKVSLLRDPIAIREIEPGYEYYMAARYGQKTAIKMLTKVWKLAYKLRETEVKE